MKRCPVCGRTFDDSRNFCNADGSRLEPVEKEPEQIVQEPQDDAASGEAGAVKMEPAGMVCPACGVQYPATQKFCTKDGTRLVAAGKQNVVGSEQNAAVSRDVSAGDIAEKEKASGQVDEKAALETSAGGGGKICPKCHTRYPESQKFCTKDGTRLVLEGAEEGREASGTEKVLNKDIKPADEKQKNRVAAEDEHRDDSGEYLHEEEGQEKKSRENGRKKSGKTPLAILAVVAAAVIVAGVLYSQGIFGRSLGSPEEASGVAENETELSAAQDGAIALTEEVQENTADTAEKAASLVSTEEAVEAAREEMTEAPEEAATEDPEETEQNLILQMSDVISETYGLGDQDHIYYTSKSEDGNLYYFTITSSDVVTDVPSEYVEITLGTVSVDSNTMETEIVEGMQERRVRNLNASEIEEDVATTADGAETSYAVIDLNTWDKIGSSNMSQRESASVMIDVPILYTAMEGLENGTISLDDPVTFHYEVDGRIKLEKEDDGNTYPLREMLSYMLQYSDNNATNSLIEYFGSNNITQTCRNASFESVTIAAKIGKTEEYTDNDNYVSASDLVGMLYDIWHSDTEINADYLRSYMLIQDSAGGAGIGKNISDDTDTFLNLNALTNSKYNEVAIVEKGDQAYCIAIMENHGKLENLEEAAAVLGSDVYAGTSGTDD